MKTLSPLPRTCTKLSGLTAARAAHTFLGLGGVNALPLGLGGISFDDE